MTKFHVTLDGVEKNDSFNNNDKTADLRSLCVRIHPLAFRTHFGVPSPSL
jgi:hypothetical protein